jgi:hypothetical protein
MAASLCLEPFPGRGLGTMPAVEPPASSALGKALSDVRRGLPRFAVKEKMKASPPCGEGSLQRQGFSPSREKVAYERRLGTYPEGQDLRVHGGRILPGSPCHPPGTRMGDALQKSSATALQKTSLPR